MAADSDLKHSEAEFPTSIRGSMFVDTVSLVLSCDICPWVLVTSSTTLFTFRCSFLCLQNQLCSVVPPLPRAAGECLRLFLESD